jgi:hypothetical protein
MKISKQRLKQIIKEEIENADPQPNPEQNVKALGQFSAKLLELSKEIRGVKGLDAKEMTEILDIFSDLVKFASGKSGGALITQISALINKKTGIEQ